jgi:zinc protease
VVAARRRQRLIALAFAAAAGLTCGTAGQPPPAHVFPVQELTLPSGLKLVIEQDDVSQIAGVVVVVDAGSVDDPAGKKGMAHVLEHLLFRVPDETGLSVQRRFIKLGAASFNAETGIERTTYHAFGPRQTLDDLVAIILGRLADPLRGANQSDVAKEVSITAEELRKREGAAGYEFLMPELLPPGHPVGRAYADLRRSDPLSLADVRAFADVFYRPDRMTVVISGPLPPGWEKTLAAKMPAALRGDEARRQPPVRRPTAAFDGPARGGAELPPHRAHVDVPELWMAWRVPPAVGVGARTASVVAHVVDQVLSSRLAPDGTNDVLDVDGFAFAGNLSTVVGCRFKLRSASDAVRIRDETNAALEALGDVTLVHIKGRLWWSHVRALQAATLTTALDMESIQGRALARAELAHSGSPAMISSVLGALEQLTVDDISAYAERYLKPGASRAVLVVPEQTAAGRGGRSGANDPIVAPGAEPDPSRALREEQPELPDRAHLLAVTQVPGARAALVRTLSNGLTVIAQHRPGLPFVSMLLGFHADPQPGDTPGARDAYDNVLHWNLSEGPLERGLLRATERHADDRLETLSMFSANVGKALDFLSEEADSLHVFWPNPAFGRYLDESAATEATPEGQAERAFRTALFHQHPYELTPATAVMRQVTERQAQAWFERVRRPANGALIIVGEIDPEGVVRDAERALRGWKGDPTAPPWPPAPPVPPPAAQTPADVVVASSGAKEIFTTDPRRRTADLHFGCFLPPVQTLRDAVVNRLLGAMFADRLFGRLRWNMGVSYSSSVRTEWARGGTSWFDGRVDVDARALAEALEILHSWLDDRTRAPINPLSFEQLRWAAARRSGLMNATGRELASSLFDAWNMGWAPAVLDDYPRDLASVTVADLTAALETCRRTAVISVLGPDQE